MLVVWGFKINLFCHLVEIGVSLCESGFFQNIYKLRFGHRPCSGLLKFCHSVSFILLELHITNIFKKFYHPKKKFCAHNHHFPVYFVETFWVLFYLAINNNFSIQRVWDDDHLYLVKVPSTGGRDLSLFLLSTLH